MKNLINFLLKNSWKASLAAIIAGLITGVCNTAAIGLINEGIKASVNASQTLILVFLAVCVLLPLTRVISQILLTRLSQKVVFDLRIHLARQILSVPLRKLEENGAGKLLSVLTGDIGTIGMALTAIPTTMMSLAIVLSGFGYLFYMFWPAALASLVAVILGVGVYAGISRIAMGYMRIARNHQDHLFSHLNALIDGAKELKLNQRRRNFFMTEMLGSASDTYRHNNVMGSGWFAGAASIGQLILFLTVGLLVFILPHFFPELDVSVLTGYAMVLMYMVLPLEGLTNTIPGFTMAGIALQKVEDLGVQFASATKEGELTGDAKADWKKISYHKIVHSYFREKENEHFELGPIDLEFGPGEVIFLIGGNGSGKTTLAKMLLGLYLPEGGEVRLDGELVTDANRDQFRQQFSAIFSDFFLFKDMMGLCPPEKQAIADEFLKRLHLEQKVQIKDGHLSSIDLSAGQRKRLALLTAYLEDRPVYLFDEWASDQDPLFKEIFYKILVPSLKERGKTVIVISHDDRYFNLADRILKLDYGQLVVNTTDVHNASALFQIT